LLLIGNISLRRPIVSFGAEFLDDSSKDNILWLIDEFSFSLLTLELLYKNLE